MTHSYEVGDQIVIVTNYWKAGGGNDRMWHPTGTVGTVLGVENDLLYVEWSEHQRLYIDAECVQPDLGPVTEEQMNEVMAILRGESP